MNNHLTKVQNNNEVLIDSSKIDNIVQCSHVTNLTERQMSQIVNAFNAKAYDMAAEYVWKKSITRLKEAVLSLGEEFVSELLQEGNNSIVDVYSALTDYKTINLAEQLGMIPHAGAMELRQSLESLQFYFSSIAAKENSYIDDIKVLNIIKTCVVFILSKPNMDVSVEFSSFRKMLLTKDIKEADVSVSQLRQSSLFFIRTVCTVLMSAMRNSQNVYFEHAVNNFKIILPLLWDKLPDEDRQKVGFLYRDVVSDGNNKAAMGIKYALSQNGGFDYVPENLRSQSFITAASALIDVHFEYENFYREPRYVKELASLGTFIPDPATNHCMKAYILVYIGNFYGVSNSARPIAYNELKEISEEKWVSFFDKFLPYDIDLICALSASSLKPIRNFLDLLRQLGKNKLNVESSKGKSIYRAILMQNSSYFTALANEYK